MAQVFLLLAYPEVMGVSMDLTEVPDEELKAEARRREREAAKARAEAQLREAQLAWEMEEAKDAEFARGIGITYEQFEEAENYIREKIWAERG